MNRNNKKENYDTGYNQNTTFRDCQRKLFMSHDDIAFLTENNTNSDDNINNCESDCNCDLQYLKVKFSR